MRLKCAAINCSNNRRVCPDKSFFRFPKEGNRCKQWVINAGRMDLLQKNPSSLYASRCICSDHFEDAMFMNRIKRNSLVWNALPTKFDLGSPSHKQQRALGELVTRCANRKRTGKHRPGTEDSPHYCDIHDILEVSMTEDHRSLTFSDVSYRMELQVSPDQQQQNSEENDPLDICSLETLSTIETDDDHLDFVLTASTQVQNATARSKPGRTRLRTPAAKKR